MESLSLEVSYRFFATPQVTHAFGTKLHTTNTHHNELVGLVASF